MVNIFRRTITAITAAATLSGCHSYPFQSLETPSSVTEQPKKPAPASPFSCEQKNSFSIQPLLYEKMDRTVSDRGLDSSDRYEMTTAEPDPNAHPFTDGNGRSLGISEERLHMTKVAENSFLSQGLRFHQTARVFVQAETVFRELSREVQAKIRYFIYHIKFDNDNFGLSPDLRSIKIILADKEWQAVNVSVPDITAADERTMLRGGMLELALFEEGKLTRRLILKDNEAPQLDGKLDENHQVRTALIWKIKNRRPFLRSVLFYSDSPSDYLKKDEGIGLPLHPQAVNIRFSGIDPKNYETENYDGLEIAVNEGSFTYTAEGSEHTRETIQDSNLIRVRSSVRGAFQLNGSAGNELVFLFGNGTNRTDNLSGGAESGFLKPFLQPGDVLMRLNNGKYVFVGSTAHGKTKICYLPGGSSCMYEYGGALFFGFADSMKEITNKKLDFSVSRDSYGSPRYFVIGFSEDSGIGLSAGKADIFTLLYDSVKGRFGEEAGKYNKNKIRYAPPSAIGVVPLESDTYETDYPFNAPSGFVTHRGSITENDGTGQRITVKIPRRPVSADFVLVEKRCK